jgi:hypothetical protein
MSLWTPSGEHEVAPDHPPDPGPDAPAGGGDPATEVDELRRQLASAPAEMVVANHCYGLFELAAVYLSDSTPKLEQARLAIDALGHLVDGLGPRLGDATRSLQEALAQIRLAYVQLDAADRAGAQATAEAGQRPAGNGAAG